MRERGTLIALAALLLTALGLALVFAGSASRGSFSSEGSTYRAAPDGARGLYLFVRELGFSARRRHLDLEIIEEKPDSVMVLVGIHGGSSCEADRPHQPQTGEGGETKPAKEDREESPCEGCGGPFSISAVEGAGLRPLECGALREWVAGGGTLIHVAGSRDALLSSMGIRFYAVEEQELGPEELLTGQPSRLTSGVERISTPVAGFVSAEDGDEIVLLEQDERKGRPVAISRRYGEGRIVVVSAPAMATNRWLGKADNAVFWASLFGGLDRTDLVFVEHHHGHGDKRGIMGYVLGRGLLPAVLQLLLVFVIGVAAARRLGPSLPPPEKQTSHQGDFLSAMSRIYELGNHLHHAGETIARRAFDEASGLNHEPEIAAALDSLAEARARLGSRLRAGRAGNEDVTEVARRAAAVYHALDERRAAPKRGRAEGGSPQARRS